MTQEKNKVKVLGDSGQARMTKAQNIFQIKSFGPYNLFCMKVEHGEYAKITDYVKTIWKEAKRLKLNCAKLIHPRGDLRSHLGIPIL